jgi:hypothetical protein
MDNKTIFYDLLKPSRKRKPKFREQFPMQASHVNAMFLKEVKT